MCSSVEQYMRETGRNPEVGYSDEIPAAYSVDGASSVGTGSRTGSPFTKTFEDDHELLKLYNDAIHVMLPDTSMSNMKRLSTAEIVVHQRKTHEGLKPDRVSQESWDKALEVEAEWIRDRLHGIVTETGGDKKPTHPRYYTTSTNAKGHITYMQDVHPGTPTQVARAIDTLFASYRAIRGPIPIIQNIANAFERGVAREDLEI